MQLCSSWCVRVCGLDGQDVGDAAVLLQQCAAQLHAQGGCWELGKARAVQEGDLGGQELGSGALQSGCQCLCVCYDMPMGLEAPGWSCDKLPSRRLEQVPLPGMRVLTQVLHC